MTKKKLVICQNYEYFALKKIRSMIVSQNLNKILDIHPLLYCQKLRTFLGKSFQAKI